MPKLEGPSLPWLFLDHWRAPMRLESGIVICCVSVVGKSDKNSLFWNLFGNCKNAGLMSVLRALSF